ncbi:MAG: MMPL family transporter [candidate division Zixibacteria bacterium]|nr:MMPL family transporter [candidate division Zixibacteria bacterium]
MRERMLTSWGRFSAEHPGLIIIGIIILMAAAMFSASRLEMKMRWSDLLPLEDPMVQEFDKIQKDYIGTSNSIIVVIGPQQQMKDFADEIVPKIEPLKEYVERVDHKIEEDFIESHGLMLSKTKDLGKMVDNRLFSDLNLAGFLTHTNDNFEDIYIGDDESLSDKEKEDNAIRSLDGIEFWIETMTKLIDDEKTEDSLVAEMLLVGDPYFISPDKRMLMIMIEPNFDITDIEAAVASTDTIQSIIDNTLAKYQSITAGLTGTIPLARDEMVYAEKDMGITSIVAFALVMLLFIFSFRMVTAPILAGLTLIISILLASGTIALFIGSLNIMTSMFAVILIGLGIDFSIHIISLYFERRAIGDNVSRAIEHTLSRSGSGIITGGLTTAIAFLTLMISQTRGIKEMGLVLGVGILSVMITTLLLLPALLVTRERIIDWRARRSAKPAKMPRPVEFAFLGKSGTIIKNKPKTTLGLAILMSIVMLLFALNAEFDYNYLNMEPEGIPSVALQDSMLVAFDMSPDFVMVTTSTVEEARRISRKAKKLQSVSMVESISNYLPSQAEQAERLPLIKQLRNQLINESAEEYLDAANITEFIKQLERLDMNIYELGQMAFIGGQDKVDSKCNRMIGDPETGGEESKIIKLIDLINAKPRLAASALNNFQKDFRPKFQKMALGMADTSILTVDNLPADIKDRYLNNAEDKFLVTIFPKEQVWDYEFLGRFNEQMQRISEKITGTPPLMLRLVELIGQDGKTASLLAIVVVLLLLWLDFRKLRLAFIAMMPLVFGAIWMIGLLTILGLPLTIVNVMALPMIIGIGIDDGVHLVHRYRVEGWDKTRTVLGSTGRAILLTSLTTMAGFGSLLLAKYRGFGSLGSLLVLGVAACFITSILFLPSLINLLFKKNGAAAE